jgi:hypothetical protein
MEGADHQMDNQSDGQGTKNLAQIKRERKE